MKIEEFKNLKEVIDPDNPFIPHYELDDGSDELDDIVIDELDEG